MALPERGPCEPDARRRAGLRAALWLPPTAWFLALVAGYALVPWACRSGGGRLALHLVSLSGLGAAAVGVGAAWRAWRRAGRRWPGEGPDPVDSSRFLAVVALLTGTLFGAIIVIQWAAILALGACEPGPRTPFSPHL